MEAVVDGECEVVDVEVERREEKRRAGLDELEGLVLLVEGDAAVAVALVTDGAEGCAGVMVARVRRMGAAAEGILVMFFGVFVAQEWNSERECT